MNRQKGVANYTFCINRYDRVGSNEAMKLFIDLHLDTKAPTWRTRYLNPRHLASIHARYLHLRTLSYAIEIRKLRI